MNVVLSFAAFAITWVLQHITNELVKILLKHAECNDYAIRSKVADSVAIQAALFLVLKLICAALVIYSLYPYFG